MRARRSPAAARRLTPPASTTPTPPAPAAPPAGVAASSRDLRTVQLDAIVVDRAGRPVLHLQPRDFDLRDDGAPQAIDRVEFRTASIRPPGPAATTPSGRPPATVAGGAERGGRAFGLLLDDYHVPAGAETARVRDLLARFADSTLTPTDTVLVMKPLDQLAAIEPAAGPAAVAEAARAFSGRAGDFSPRTAFERDFIGHAPAAAEAARAQLVLSALERLTIRLGRLQEGRKALLFVTEGFARVDRPRTVPLPDLQAVLRAANRFDVAIYPIDPAEAPASGAGLAMLQTLAGRTGGSLMTGGADLTPRLARLAQDLNGYYLLTFRSRHPDGRFHAISLRVDRPGVEVRTRPEYWLPSEAEVRLAELATRERLPPRLPPIFLVPTHVSGLIQPWFGIARGADGRTQLTVTWEPGQPGLEGRLPVDAGEIVLDAVTASGTSLFHGTLAPASSGEAARSLPRRAVFDAPPGHIRLDMQIRSADGKPLGTDVRGLEVPSMDGPDTTLSTPEVFRAITARGFLTISRDPDAAPVVSREFSTAERLLIRVRAYGPGATPPVVTARLLNLLGRPMRTLTRLPGSLPDGSVQFDLPLEAFPPGQYSIEVTATGPGGEATSLIALRIIG